jgi:hypothetical protein
MAGGNGRLRGGDGNGSENAAGVYRLETRIIPVRNPAHLAGRLRRARLRATLPKLQVQEVFLENPGFQRVGEIHRRLSERRILVDIDAVYRALREMRA